MPSLPRLAYFRDALSRGWLPDEGRPQRAREDLSASVIAPEAFMKRLTERNTARSVKGRTVVLSNGTRVPRLPSIVRWIWDDGFCGSIALRWVPGTSQLPEYVLGHIGYSVVPWRRGEGLATAALGGILPAARECGLDCVTLTTDPANYASISVISKNGGRGIDRLSVPMRSDRREMLVFKIDLG